MNKFIAYFPIDAIIYVTLSIVFIFLFNLSHYIMSELTGHSRGKNILYHMYRRIRFSDIIVISDFFKKLIHKNYKNNEKQKVQISLVLFIVGIMGFSILVYVFIISV